MNQTEDNHEIWKIEIFSTQNNCDPMKQIEHSHDYFQIIWVKKGQGQYTINFENKEITDNSLIFIEPDIRHNVYLCGEMDIVNITFSTSFLEYLCPKMETLVK